MLRALRREADRRRHGNGEYGWLFLPYMGDELVSIACRESKPQGQLVVAAVRLRGDRVLTSESLECHVAPSTRQVATGDERHLDEVLAQFLEFIGNRPLVGWHLEREYEALNRLLRPRFGFGLPNSGIDVAQRYHRWQRHHPHAWPSFECIAESLGVPVMGRYSALGDAVTTALMYLRLARRMAQE